MQNLPAEKQWEMYDAVMQNCQDCSKWKSDINKRIGNIELFVGITTAIGAFLYGLLLWISNFFQGSLNHLINKGG